MQINVVTQRLIELLQENPAWTGRKTVTRIAEELGHPEPAVVVEAGRRLLDDLHARNILVGTRRGLA